MMLCESIKDLTNLDLNNYVAEVKYDGTRVLTRVSDKLRMINRRGVSVNDRFKDVVVALKQLPKGTTLDGEIVIFVNGKCDFNRLISREHTTDGFKLRLMRGLYPATYMVFDVIEYKGMDCEKLPLIERKQILNSLNKFESGNFKVVEYGDVHSILELAKEEEGIILKKKNSKYSRHIRCNDWLKFKNRVEKEVKFTQYEKNKDDSLTLTDGFHRVKCNSPAVQREIDKVGFVVCEVEGLNFTPKGHIRMPIIKRVVM